MKIDTKLVGEGFLGIPNKYISYSIVTWLNSILIPACAAILQSKSFLSIDYVPTFSWVTPVTIAIIYYLLKMHIFSRERGYSAIKDIIVAVSLCLFFYGFFYFIVIVREYILNLSLINYLMQLSIFASPDLFFLLMIMLLTLTLWIVREKNKKLTVSFIVFCCILEGFLFFLAINAIHKINAEPLDFLNSFSKVILIYVIVWTLVSIYVALLDIIRDKVKT
jgi:hypothetical protein